METIVAILAVILGVAGIVGSVIPALPGPPLSWIGILMMYFRKGADGNGDPMTSTLMLVLLGVTVLVTVLDYVVPAWFTKFSGGSRHAARGATVGLILGLILPLPFGMIAASLIGAFVAEFFFGGKGVAKSLKASIGAFLGFLFGTGIKLIASAVMMYYIIVYI